MKRLVSLALGACLLSSAPAWADVPYSTLSGKTVGEGVTTLHPELGWPGISASLLSGISDRVDLGGRFSFNYGFEGSFSIIPGLRLQGLVRVGILDKPKFNFGLTFEPGFLMYFSPFGVLPGLTIPVGLVFGVPVSDELMLNFGLNLPLFFLFQGFAGMPILFGGGLEYFIAQDMALTFNLRLGPAIFFTNGATDFALQALIGLSFKL